MATVDPPLPVVHLLDALTDAGPGLWGKERVVAHVMEAQRASGRYDPSAAVFTECSLAALLRERGFVVNVLAERHRRIPVAATNALGRALAGRTVLVHSHEYKANVVARFLRRTGAPMHALVSTAHAWFDDTPALKAYNAIDRATSGESDANTVADRHMTLRFPRNVRAEFVANGLPDRPPASPDVRAAARVRYGFSEDRFVAGYLARTSVAKGIGVFCDAARASFDPSVLYAAGGSGENEDLARDAALSNLRYLGYISESDEFRSAIDCYVQSSFVEGLSLSLLEAMRAGLPIVATDAGSTRAAIRDGIDGFVVPTGDPAAIARAVGRFAEDVELRTKLGASARARFLSHFSIERQIERFGEIYDLAMARRCGVMLRSGRGTRRPSS